MVASTKFLATKLLVASLFACVALAPATADAKRVSLALSHGDDVLVVGDETLSVRAQCMADDGGVNKVRLYAVTSSDAVMRGFNSYLGNGSYLTPGSPAAMSVLSQVIIAPGVEVAGLNVDVGFFVFNLAEREGYAFSAETTALTLNLGGSDCLVSADYETIKKFKAVD